MDYPQKGDYWLFIKKPYHPELIDEAFFLDKPKRDWRLEFTETFGITLTDYAHTTDISSYVDSDGKKVWATAYTFKQHGIYPNKIDNEPTQFAKSKLTQGIGISQGDTDPINHPSYYKVFPIESKDMCAILLDKMEEYCGLTCKQAGMLQQALQYRFRAGYKGTSDEDILENIKKAMFWEKEYQDTLVTPEYEKDKAKWDSEIKELKSKEQN